MLAVVYKLLNISLPDGFLVTMSSIGVGLASEIFSAKVLVSEVSVKSGIGTSLYPYNVCVLNIFCCRMLVSYAVENPKAYT